MPNPTKSEVLPGFGARMSVMISSSRFRMIFSQSGTRGRKSQAEGSGGARNRRKSMAERVAYFRRSPVGG